MRVKRNKYLPYPPKPDGKVYVYERRIHGFGKGSHTGFRKQRVKHTHLIRLDTETALCNLIDIDWDVILVARWKTDKLCKRCERVCKTYSNYVRV